MQLYPSLKPQTVHPLKDKLAYPDDIVKLNSHEHFLQTDTYEVVSATETLGMVVNTVKMKVPRVSKDSAPRAS